jgi:hypothetical protein
MLLSVMPYRSKVLPAAVLSALKNIMHFSNSGLGTKYNFYTEAGSGLPSNLGATALGLQWSNAAKSVGEISCNAVGTFYLEFTVSNEYIISIFPSDSVIAGGGYYPSNSVSWYRINATSAQVVNYVGTSETARISCNLTGTAAQTAKVWMFCTIKADKTMDVEFVYYDGTLKKTAIKTVPNPGNKPFKISCSTAYSLSQTCIVSTKATYWDSVRAGMGFDAFRLSNYPAHAAMTDLISLVPRMTADSSGGFTASASSSLLNPAWQPFSMDNEGNLIDVGYGGTGGWACGVKPTVGSPQWISIVFPSQLSTSKVCLSLWNSVSADWAAFRNAYSILKDFEIQTFDGTTWTTQVTVTNFNYTAYEYGRYNFITFNLPTPTTCVGMRIKITALHLGSSGWDNGLIRCIYLE